MALSEERRRELGERLAELRGEGRPMRVICEKLSVTERTYGAWERGEQGISWEHLEEVAAFFEVSTNYLLFGSDERPGLGGGQLDAIERELSRQGVILDALADALEDELGARFAAAVRRARRQARSTPRAADRRGRA